VTARVIFTDLELFLTGFIRGELTARGKTGGFISNEFSPADKPRPTWQVIVRDDSGPRSSIVTKTPTVGITVLGSDTFNKVQTADLALLVSAIVDGSARVATGNPVAAVLGSNGPYKVPDDTGPRRYMTFELSVTGNPFT
jgi:hypothetical protein